MGHEARRGWWGWVLRAKKETREVQAILDCCLLNVLFINNSATAVTP